MGSIKYTKDQQDFVNEALAKISSNPFDRVTPITKAVLARNNFVFDAHCHIFDGQCIDVWYLIIRTVNGFPLNRRRNVWNLIRPQDKRIKLLGDDDLEELIYEDDEMFNEIKDTGKFFEELKNTIEAKLSALRKKTKLSQSEKETIEDGGKIKDLLKLVSSKKMSNVYDGFEKEYAVHNVVPGNKELLSVILGMDIEYGWKTHEETKRKRREVKIKKSNAQQITELNDLANEIPIFPFVPLDPRRAQEKDDDKNLYKIFLKAFAEKNSNYFGVKIYPALGYLPSDQRLAPIFEVCAKRNIPVLSHCGGEMVSTFDKKIMANDNGNIIKIPGLFRKKRSKYLNDPERWKSVLDRKECANLHLSLAHFGSITAWKKPNSDHAKRIPIILDMMARKDVNVFTDFSFNLNNDHGTDSFVKMMTDNSPVGKRNAELIKTKCMFGTDFWVVLPMSDLVNDQREFLQKVGTHGNNMLTKNVLAFLQLQNMIA